MVIGILILFKFDTNTNKIINSTCIGRGKSDLSDFGLKINKDGGIIIACRTMSTDFFK